MIELGLSWYLHVSYNHHDREIFVGDSGTCVIASYEYFIYEPRDEMAFSICKNKDADQLRGNRTANQHLCFRCLCFIYIGSTIPILSISEVSRL